MATIQQQLQHVYKANQCTDLSDVNYAISEVKRIANGNYSASLRRRLYSLEKRKEALNG